MTAMTNADSSDEPRAPSAYQIEQAVSAWQQLKATLLADEDLADDKNPIGRALMAANITDPHILLERLIDATIWLERRADEAADLESEMYQRKQRYSKRVERFRFQILDLLRALELKSRRARLAQALLTSAPPSTVITDEEAIPDKYFKTTRTLNRQELLHDLKAGEDITGASLSTGGTTLQIRKLR